MLEPYLQPRAGYEVPTGPASLGSLYLTPVQRQEPPTTKTGRRDDTARRVRSHPHSGEAGPYRHMVPMDVWRCRTGGQRGSPSMPFCKPSGGREEQRAKSPGNPGYSLPAEFSGMERCSEVSLWSRTMFHWTDVAQKSESQPLTLGSARAPEE